MPTITLTEWGECDCPVTHYRDRFEAPVHQGCGKCCQDEGRQVLGHVDVVLSWHTWLWRGVFSYAPLLGPRILAGITWDDPCKHCHFLGREHHESCPEFRV